MNSFVSVLASLAECSQDQPLLMRDPVAGSRQGLACINHPS